MIRIDYKRDGKGHVNTTWVKEDGNSHSMMGRVIFDEPDFEKFFDNWFEDGRGGQVSQKTTGIIFEEKK